MRTAGDALLELAFVGEAIVWRGPAPYVFVAIPEEEVAAVRDAARRASYGWGCVPVSATVRGTDFTTSLFPRGDTYMLPLKVAVRRDAAIKVGEMVHVSMRIASGSGRN